MSKQAFLLVVALLTAPAWAINKCVIDGKIVYQQLPCQNSGELVGDELNRREQERRLANEAEAARTAYHPASGEAGVSYVGRSYRRDSGVVHTGPRGGRYTINSSGRKNYVSRGRR